MGDGLLTGHCLLNVRITMNAPTKYVAKSTHNPIPRHWLNGSKWSHLAPRTILKWKNKPSPWPHGLLCCFARSPPATAWRTLQQMTLLRAWASHSHITMGCLGRQQVYTLPPTLACLRVLPAKLLWGMRVGNKKSNLPPTNKNPASPMATWLTGCWALPVKWTN